MGMQNLDIPTKGKVIHCLHCKNQTYVNLVAHYTKSWDIDEACIYGKSEWNLYLCPVCDEVTLELISECSDDLYYDNDGESHIDPTISILYPLNPINTFPEPHKDLPKELINDYEEARSIAHLSPRSAAALLRLLVEKLCVDLGAEGKGINDYIADLVKRGLPQKVQQAFDILRLVGNSAVHPGEINLKDNLEIVSNLFIVINIAVEYLITQPKLLEKMYSGLPKQKLDAIIKRDTNQ